MKIPKVKSTNFFNDVVRVLSFFNKFFRNRDNSRVKGFFARVFREMKR